MTKPTAPLLARALRVLRTLRGWDQGTLARSARLDRSTIRRLEAGDIELSRERLEGFGVLMEAKRGQVEMAIAFAATEDAPEGEAPGSGASDPRDRLIEATLANADAEMRRLLERTRWESDLAAAKADAAQRWRVLAPLPHANRLALVEDCPDFPTPALCARLCDESERAASRSVVDTVDIAKLALRVADLLPESKGTVRGRAYTHAFVANSHRVANEFGEGDRSIARCRERFPYGHADPTGLFPESRVLDLEASLRRNEGRIGEAVSLLDRALAICSPGDRARVLLKQATTFEQSGDSEKVRAALREALPAVERAGGEPRFRWLLRWNLGKHLLVQGSPEDVAVLLPELRRLTIDLAQPLDFLRLRWLEAKVAAAKGEIEPALVELAAVRRAFAAIPLFADAAIVGLHEAEILLREGRTGRVRELMAVMQAIFETLGLNLEELAAVRLFVEAANRDTATVEMARAAVRALCRAPRNV
ncbi:MAG TPA: helix-turn-helix transcriptional regulator [Thermoanaerobaculia bacterium]|nr:helix-turn-helix transcriptional regulator [Thermoanaerobaculia bacterium]